MRHGTWDMNTRDQNVVNEEGTLNCWVVHVFSLPPSITVYFEGRRMLTCATAAHYEHPAPLIHSLPFPSSHFSVQRPNIIIFPFLSLSHTHIPFEEEREKERRREERVCVCEREKERERGQTPNSVSSLLHFHASLLLFPLSSFPFHLLLLCPGECLR